MGTIRDLWCAFYWDLEGYRGFYVDVMEVYITNMEIEAKWDHNTSQMEVWLGLSIPAATLAITSLDLFGFGRLLT